VTNSIIKPKSLIVALTSSFIIAMVLVLTIASYAIYVEIRARESKMAYQELLKKVNAKFYSKYIQTSALAARIETTGALKDKPVIEGEIKNAGYRAVTGIMLKVKFLDKDGAVIYEYVFNPQEPSLGTSTVTQVAINYILGPSKGGLRPGTSLAFKRILTNCPDEIINALRERSQHNQGTPRWDGKLDPEVLSLEF
jgi:hypothetical protein